MTTEGRDGERAAVRTYVTENQRDEWDREAERLEMSRAEYVRSMVQAGRRGFTLEEPDAQPENPSEGPCSDVDPGGDGLRTRILDVLEREGPCSWDEIVAEVTQELEDQVDAELEVLNRQGVIEQDSRTGNHRVTENGE